MLPPESFSSHLTTRACDQWRGWRPSSSSWPLCLVSPPDSASRNATCQARTLPQGTHMSPPQRCRHPLFGLPPAHTHEHATAHRKVTSHTAHCYTTLPYHKCLPYSPSPKYAGSVTRGSRRRQLHEASSKDDQISSTHMSPPSSYTSEHATAHRTVTSHAAHCYTTLPYRNCLP